MVRASLLGANAPVYYWGKSLFSTVYLINLVPSSIINFQTPFNVMSKAIVALTVPNLPLYVFGCVAFFYLPKEQLAYLWDIHLFRKDIDIIILLLEKLM